MDHDEERTKGSVLPVGMALFGAVTGLLFHLAIDTARHGDLLAVWRQAIATFIAVAGLSFLLTVDRRRWHWSALFALAWGAVMALVGWSTASYNHVSNIFEFPYLSGLGAVLVAAPLFQAARDEGARRFPIEGVHRHVWSDAVIGLFALLFTGLSFLVAFLIGALFKLIGIEAIHRLLDKEWFDWTLAGMAFGAAVGIMREREALLTTVRKLVMAILVILAPVVAVALWSFFLALPFTGLKTFWESGVPPTPLLLIGAFGAFALTNVIIGDGTEKRAPARFMRWIAMGLAAAILPLALLAAVSLNQRIGQYGWSPERLWGVLAIGLAALFGIASWRSLVGRREHFADMLRPLQVKLALLAVGAMAFLALPILDFGSISAKSQLARLEAGKVKIADFDWEAMAFKFGPSGRQALERIAANGTTEQRPLAAIALKSENRHTIDTNTRAASLDSRVRRLPDTIMLTPELRKELSDYDGCGDRSCVLIQLDSQRLLLVYQPYTDSSTLTRVIDLRALKDGTAAGTRAVERTSIDLGQGEVEVRSVQRRQVFVDGKPVGDIFE